MNDFDRWNILKKKINKKDNLPLFEEGDLWWCNLGKNVGIETFGKGKYFSRPVLIIKKHNINQIVIIPATKQPKLGKFYYKIESENETSYLLLSQIKVIDTKRLIKIISQVNQEEITEIKKAVYEINFQ